jgi:hypothetical protein
LAQALKAGNVCSDCKELPPMQKGSRKFTRCVDCRAEATRLAWHRRKNLRELRNMVGGLVEYNDGGWRAGYLAEIYNKSTVWVQPIGTMLQVPQKVCLGVEEVKPALVGSKKWPRMEDYVKAVLIMRPSKAQPKPAAPDVPAVVATVVTLPGSEPAVVTHVGLDLAEKIDIALPHVGDSGRSEIAMDMPKAVAMYKAGQTWTEIAVAMGYPRGKGQNRCKRAVEKAGAL